MKKLLLFLCVASLLANLALGWRAWLDRQRRTAETGLKVAAAPRASHAAPAIPAALFEAGDPTAVRDALRKAGADERMVRAVVDGMLRHNYQQKLTTERLGALRSGWWKNRVTLGTDDPKLLREQVTDPRRQLLGPNPLDLIDAEARYAFLPPEKRRKLAQIDQDYREMLAQLQVQAGPPSAQTRAEQEQLQLLAKERRKDVLAELTPEEQAELSLRFSEAANLTITRMENMAATEAEYRFIKPVLEDYLAKSRMLPPGDQAARAALERGIVQQWVDRFGYDRAVDLTWSGYNEYAALARAVRGTELPANTAGSVMTLSSETGRQAAAIHGNATLDMAQKRAALADLQQASRAKLETLLPPATQRLLEPSTFRWLNELTDGKYQVPTAGLMGGNGFMIGSLTQPPIPPQLLDRPTIPVRPPAR